MGNFKALKIIEAKVQKSEIFQLKQRLVDLTSQTGAFVCCSIPVDQVDVSLPEGSVKPSRRRVSALLSVGVHWIWVERARSGEFELKRKRKSKHETRSAAIGIERRVIG
ncbi:hypothetical protein V6N12_075205 [Hibiscus sabdariffa]|uniref:Uncharacterized protein n=1 Tax=Hibiscus sabdariffa TaxID=183260 RepID=A0ABR2C1A0_9ROSI